DDLEVQSVAQGLCVRGRDAAGDEPIAIDWHVRALIVAIAERWLQQVVEALPARRVRVVLDRIAQDAEPGALAPGEGRIDPGREHVLVRDVLADAVVEARIAVIDDLAVAVALQ